MLGDLVEEQCAYRLLDLSYARLDGKGEYVWIGAPEFLPFVYLID